MNIYEKLSAIQAELKAPKSQFNSFGNYHYRKAEDILEAVKPIAKAHGCAVLCSDDLLLVGNRYYIKATATIVDTTEGTQVSTTAFAREEETKKGMDGSQVTGASSSYARKYALNGLFCIDDTQDSDTTNVGDQNTPAKPAKPSKPAAPKPAPKLTQQTLHESWIKSLATGAVNAQGITAEQAYREKFRPSEEEWALILDEVYHYKQEHNIA